MSSTIVALVLGGLQFPQSTAIDAERHLTSYHARRCRLRSVGIFAKIFLETVHWNPDEDTEKLHVKEQEPGPCWRAPARRRSPRGAPHVVVRRAPSRHQAASKAYRNEQCELMQSAIAFTKNCRRRGTRGVLHRSRALRDELRRIARVKLWLSYCRLPQANLWRPSLLLSDPAMAWVCLLASGGATSSVQAT